jgi:hypothetical protein
VLGQSNRTGCTTHRKQQKVCGKTHVWLRAGRTCKHMNTITDELHHGLQGSCASTNSHAPRRDLLWGLHLHGLARGATCSAPAVAEGRGGKVPSAQPHHSPPTAWPTCQLQ